MFVLNNDVVSEIIDSSTFNDEFKNTLKDYSGRVLSEEEVNIFLDILFNNIIEGRRIKNNLFNEMLGLGRVSRLDTMLEGIRRSNRNNTLTDTDLSFIRNNLLRNFIIDDASEIQANNEMNINSVTEEFNRIHEELESQGLSIGLVRLREIINELTDLHQKIFEVQSQARLNTDLDDNELRDVLVSGNDLWNSTSNEIYRVNQMIDAKERLIESKNEQITMEETHVSEINNLLTLDRAHLIELEKEVNNISDNNVRSVLQSAISQTRDRITSEEKLIEDRNDNIESLHATIDIINNGGELSELSETVINEGNIDLEDNSFGESSVLTSEYDEILKRLENRNINEIGLGELNSIRADLIAAHNLSQDLQNRNRMNPEIDLNELRNSLIKAEEIWNSVRNQVASIDRAIEAKNNLLQNYNSEINETNERIRVQEGLITSTQNQISRLEEVMKNTTDEFVLKSYQETLDALNKSLQNEQNILSELRNIINDTNRKVEIINNGGKLDVDNEEVVSNDPEVNTNLDSELYAKDQMNVLKNKYNEIVSRLAGRNIDELGVDELEQIYKEFEQLHKDNLKFINDVRFNSQVDTSLYNELLNESNKLYDDIRTSMIEPYEKLNEKRALNNELIVHERKTKSIVQTLNDLIKEKNKTLESLKNSLSNEKDPSVRKVYEETIKSIEKEIEAYNKQLEKYKEDLENVDNKTTKIKSGGRGNSSGRKKKESKPSKDSEEMILPDEISRRKPNGLAPNIMNVPKVKYNKPELTWKTALALAAGVGIGATVFFTTGPTGVAIMSIINGITNKFVSSARAKAAANRMNILGGEIEVEEIEEPKKGLKASIDKFKKYIKSEEGLRDISWMLTAAIITGNALSIGSVVRNKIIASQSAKPIVNPEQTPINTTESTTEIPTGHIEPTPEVTNTVVAQTPQPSSVPTDSVYSGIKLGDNVGNYNVSIGHRQASKAFGGWDPLKLNQNLVNSDSVFSEFAIVDDSGKLIQRISTPGLSLDEVCAQYGVNYSNVVLDVAKNGTPQAWISVEELVNGVTMSGPTM